MKVDCDSAYYLRKSYPFVIPVYQRNYSWTEKECKRLFNDLVRLMDNTKAHHFIGSVCVKENRDSDGNRRIVVIDGQQRLTTLSLLFLALARVAKKRGLMNLHDAIVNWYIFNDTYANNSKIPKLRLGLLDSGHYAKIISEQEDIDDESNIVRNFNFFMERIGNLSDGELSDLERSTDRLDLAILQMDDGEDAQEIFDSINSTGMDLTDVDRIRNFLLMDLDSDTQERLYIDYWNRIECILDIDDMTTFICSYLVSYGSHNISGTKISEKTLYSAFKIWYELLPKSTYENKFSSKTEYVLSSIYDSVSSYNDLILSQPATPDRFDASNDIYWCINEVCKKQLMCIAIYIMRLHNSGRISTDTRNALFKACLSYYVRNRIVPGKTAFGYQTSGNVISRFESATNQYELIPTDIAEDAIYNALFLLNRGNYRMASDSEFKAAIKTVPVYLSDKQFTKFILYTIELSDSRTRKTIPDFDAKTVSIEHILPQHPNQKWLDEFATDPDGYLHEFGNLTLTNLNSEIGNKEFTDKKIEYLKDSFPMTRAVCSNSTWTYRDVISRGEEMSEKLVQIFELPSKYESKEYIDEFRAQNIAKTSRTTFEKLGIPIGSVLSFSQKHDIVVTVADDVNQVEYDGKKYAISAAAKAIKDDMGASLNASYNGFDWFLYDGIKLTERRRRIENGELII